MRVKFKAHTIIKIALNTKMISLCYDKIPTVNRASFYNYVKWSWYILLNLIGYTFFSNLKISNKNILKNILEI